MIGKLVPDSSGGQVILDDPSKNKVKQITPAKKWIFVLNNYTNEDISAIVLVMDELCKLYFFGKELGDLKTPHLQGYCEFEVKCRPKNLLSSRIHWEKARGSRADNVLYSKKEGIEFISKGLPLPVKTITPDYDWEKEILKIVENPPDDRTIYWYWGSGGIGKTAFCKYLTVKHKAICLGGKGADMRNGIVEYMKNNLDTPRLVLINIPRTFNLDYISYEGMENIKDMYFYSGKYEGGMVCGNPPHLIVFANEEPDYDKMSSDRFLVKNLK